MATADIGLPRWGSRVGLARDTRQVGATSSAGAHAGVAESCEARETLVATTVGYSYSRACAARMSRLRAASLAAIVGVLCAAGVAGGERASREAAQAKRSLPVV